MSRRSSGCSSALRAKSEKRVLRVAHVLGLMLAIFAAGYVLPIVTSLLMADGTSRYFAVGGLVSAGAGLLLAYLTRPYARSSRATAFCS